MVLFVYFFGFFFYFWGTSQSLSSDSVAEESLEFMQKICSRTNSTKVESVPENIISLGMDGPSVNKLFNVGSCPFHTVSNGFSEGLKSIDKVDLDQFAVDLHSFFKFSAKRIEEYFDVEKFTEVYGQHMLRPVSYTHLTLPTTPYV